MRVSITLLLVLLFPSSMLAQDTLYVSLQEADRLLIGKNLSLIAAHYDIDKAAALQIQAKLFNNPDLVTEWNLYNPAKSQWVDAGKNGQRIVSLQKIFRIAGQRGTSVKLADEVKRMSEFQYEELARSLRFELHSSFYRYHFLNGAVESIDNHLQLLKSLIQIYSQQYEKGNISLQELTRLNTTYFSINKQVKDVQQELFKLQETLRILLSDERIILPRSPGSPSYSLLNLAIDQLIARALAARPEIKSTESQQRQNLLRYSLAKKEALPDLTAGFIYDQAGSYVNKYTAFTLGMKIPIFNRNQAQILTTRIGIEQGEKQKLATQQKIRNEVQSAWMTFNLLWNQYSEVSQSYEDQLNQLSVGLVNNYSKNNISLLEFTDLFEAYNTNIIHYNLLKADLNQSFEELNYAVGEDIIN